MPINLPPPSAHPIDGGVLEGCIAEFVGSPGTYSLKVNFRGHLHGIHIVKEFGAHLMKQVVSYNIYCLWVLPNHVRYLFYLWPLVRIVVHQQDPCRTSHIHGILGNFSNYLNWQNIVLKYKKIQWYCAI